ncbi:uncharacterized protein BDCG_17580 [Blastomyces dermatitidis ER-3]|uniref:Uncharacterized protein n=1 Tax=Ajellomyces dermatitidis (strain ER-3 / ATCC MYA-2586) TaxID=559297 RepID=A0ABX2VZA7_AJEDR|nr:uncharacterized protein BDCG_17580 [Blastomyces dermatitidis ER-3]OAT02473.1 hypothetical protein BDCG_17580 [Blastomyces dermatitidis ER-3]
MYKPRGCVCSKISMMKQPNSFAKTDILWNISESPSVGSKNTATTEAGLKRPDLDHGHSHRLVPPWFTFAWGGLLPNCFLENVPEANKCAHCLQCKFRMAGSGYRIPPPPPQPTATLTLNAFLFACQSGHLQM